MIQPSIESLIKDGGRHVSGLVHVGSNDGEEVPHYISLGIPYLLLFEPLSKPYNKSLDMINNLNRADTLFSITTVNKGLLDRHRIIGMNVTENDKASSILSTIDVDDWTQHEVFKDWNMGQWPVVGREACQFDRFDRLIRQYMPSGFSDPIIFNTVVMDVQGVEDKALEGFGDYLQNVYYILIELSEKPVYKGQKSGQEIALWLDKRGFDMVTPMKLHDNVLFIRRGK